MKGKLVHFTIVIASINWFIHLVPLYLKLKVQFMKVVPDGYIACMKASIDVGWWSVSLSSIKVLFLVIASVCVLIAFFEGAVWIGMQSLVVSLISYAGSWIWLNAKGLGLCLQYRHFSWGEFGLDRLTISSSSMCWFLLQIWWDISWCCSSMIVLTPFGMRQWRCLFLSGLELAI